MEPPRRLGDPRGPGPHVETRWSGAPGAGSIWA